jgi:hypothetical protein
MKPKLFGLIGVIANHISAAREGLSTATRSGSLEAAGCEGVRETMLVSVLRSM